MSTLLSQLRHKYQISTVVEQLIAINIIVFILTYFLGGIGHLFNNSQNFFYQWFALPAKLTYFVNKPWTIISYGFMHAGFPHLIFNLIALYFFGNLFLDYFTPKKLLTFYIMGTVVGGLVFLVSYSYFPALKQQSATLVGASSGIAAILIGLTTYIPNYEMKFRLIGFVKLWIIALVFIGLNLINLADNNTGGHLAHLGGAAYGFFTIYYTNSLKFKKYFKFKKTKKTPLKTSYKAKTKNKNFVRTKENQQKIDTILDKISKSGYESLSKTEKDFLFQQGKM